MLLLQRNRRQSDSGSRVHHTSDKPVNNLLEVRCQKLRAIDLAATDQVPIRRSPEKRKKKDH